LKSKQAEPETQRLHGSVLAAERASGTVRASL
jgi:hypothetical protein